MLATQNPIELEGTYPLPEAQLDRFLFNTVLDYLSAEDEMQVMDPHHQHPRRSGHAGDQRRRRSWSFSSSSAWCRSAMTVGPYVVRVVRATRFKSEEAPEFVRRYVNYGASVRAAQFIVLAAKARALARGRYHVDFDDIDCLRAAGVAPSHPAEFPRAIRPYRGGRDPAADADAACRAPERDGRAEPARPCRAERISGLDLVAATVVNGFVAGLHRSADFGFSQEFAEYRAYAPGDDLRHVDWNVYARSDRAYIKRFQGETNSQLMLLVDASSSMGFASHAVSKLAYVRFIAAALAYLATRRQRDATGLVVFGDTVRDFVPPSSRRDICSACWPRCWRRSRRRTPPTRRRWSICRPFCGVAAWWSCMSDFYAPPADIVRAVTPLRIHGNEVVLFQVLDPQELRPTVDGSSMLIDLETGAALEVSEDYVRGRYRERIDAHVADLAREARRAGIGYHLLQTDKPLDEALLQYLRLRTGRD